MLAGPDMRWPTAPHHRDSVPILCHVGRSERGPHQFGAKRAVPSVGFSRFLATSRRSTVSWVLDGPCFRLQAASPQSAGRWGPCSQNWAPCIASPKVGLLKVGRHVPQRQRFVGLLNLDRFSKENGLPWLAVKDRDVRGRK